ncbi:hypothetical protein KKC83_05785 [Patescibacteria group bacterium]|nr:hypothetical protein [Candidatus Falkowbacteria bacterium]MBU3906552.1 hypothetical protein [Patescibacteria group bacterium]MBU4027027.1 hypothetical protein [Patescibacteria group bacterium]MBU4073597.1 hypothetical protein [Patescibacteria group bacterium]MBU4102810.1 hypothetical protein [Patescibacteria group bacterium]
MSLIKRKNLFFINHNKKVVFLSWQKKAGASILSIKESNDGFNFYPSRKKPIIAAKTKAKENINKCQNFYIAKLGEKYFLTYEKAAWGAAKVFGATSLNLSKWTVLGALSGIKHSGAVVPDFFYDDERIMYTGKKNINIAYSKDLKKWREEKKIVLKTRSSKFDSNKMIPASAFVKNNEIILLYYHLGKNKKYSIGLAIFDYDNPEKLLHRSQDPVWQQTEKGKIKPLGIAEIDGKFVSYWEGEKGEIFLTILPPVCHGQQGAKITLKRIKDNPILSPIHDNAWEAVAAFNPTVFEHGGKVHILYRAMGHEAISTVGYAVSKDGVSIDERHDAPIYVPRKDFEGVSGVIFDKDITPKYMSGGGWGGCEDPRATVIDDKVYLLYAAFNGYHEPQIAISSISLKDFQNKDWRNWTMPVLITCSRLDSKNPKATRHIRKDRPGCEHTGEKDAAILPEKINGKYVIFHRIWPNIVIDFVDSLNFDGNNFLRGEHMIKIRPEMWDSLKIGLASTPVKTRDGWLLIYNAVDKRDGSKYKIGAMLLDLKDPAKVICRCSNPILEPEEYYENHGLKPGIVFAGGAIIKDGTLFVYYGGSDQHACIATHDAEDFIKQLKDDGSPKMKRII